MQFFSTLFGPCMIDEKIEWSWMQFAARGINKKGVEPPETARR